MVHSESEQLTIGQKKIDLGIASRKTLLMEVEGLSEEAAEEKLQMIDREFRFDPRAEQGFG
jgi:hypothetical protein